MSGAHSEWDDMRDRIIGLGEQSSRKSYYPELLKKIAQLEQAREDVRVSEENLQAVINGIHDAIIIHDDKGVILDVNRSVSLVVALAPEEVKSKNVYEFSSKENDFSLLPVYWSRVLAGESILFDWKVLQPSAGVVLDVEIALSPLRWYNRDVLIAVVRDISDRKKLEMMLRQSEKMDAIGQLAGGFAHDFNNMLGAILGYAELISLNAEGRQPLSEYADIIMTTAAQAADLAKRLLDFSRKGNIRKDPVPLASVLKTTVLLFERVIDRRITVISDPGPDDVLVLGDSSQLQNAFLNVCINARDAMPEGGTISIRAARSLFNSPGLYGAFRLPPGSYIEVTISDTGVGIPQPVLEKIFEPFFTTKETGKGTGLGLAAVYSCARDSGGAVYVESSEGQGSVFHLIFPEFTGTAAEGKGLRSEPDERKGRGESILVVDDEETLRTMAAEILVRLGYSVDTASDGIEGIRMFRENKGYDLVILDANMPRLSGVETLRKLREIDPSVCALFCSGYSDDELSRERESSGLTFIQKPYRISQIAGAVEKVLTSCRE